jgi:hypothetical protein
MLPTYILQVLYLELSNIFVIHYIKASISQRYWGSYLMYIFEQKGIEILGQIDVQNMGDVYVCFLVQSMPNSHAKWYQGPSMVQVGPLLLNAQPPFHGIWMSSESYRIHENSIFNPKRVVKLRGRVVHVLHLSKLSCRWLCTSRSQLCNKNGWKCSVF